MKLRIGKFQKMQLQQEKQIAKSNLLRKCGLLAHASAAFLKNCCTEKLFSCLRLVFCSLLFPQTSKKRMLRFNRFSKTCGRNIRFVVLFFQNAFIDTDARTARESANLHLIPDGMQPQFGSDNEPQRFVLLPLTALPRRLPPLQYMEHG